MIAQKKRILLDAHSLGKNQGGIETYCRNLAKFLPKGSLGLYLYANKKSKISNSFVPLFDHGLFRIFFGFKKALTERQIDIIHCNNFLPYPAPKAVKKVVTIHDICFLKEKPFPLNILFSRLIKYSLKNADHIIATSNFTKEQIIKFGGKHLEEKTTVVYQGVDEVFKKASKSEKAINSLKSRYKIKDNYFLFSGNVTRRKNPEVLNFCSKVASAHNSNLVVTGKDFTNKLIKNKNTIVLNYVPKDELATLYKHAEALLFLSDCEGFGLPIIEAMKVGTPVICSDLKVFREVAQDGALFVGDEKELNKVMERVVSDKKLRKRLVKKGKKRASEFSWERASKETIQVYKFILKKRP